MANFYALSGLTNWSQAGGWSSTSGGPSNGLNAPTSSDNVIFDANSGTARTITLNATISCNTMVCTGAPMSINGVGIYGGYIFSTNIDVSGFSSISLTSLAIGPNNGTVTTVSLKGGGCVITITQGNFTIPSCGLLLTGNLIVNGTLSISNPGMNDGGYNVSVGLIYDGGADTSGLGSLTIGAGVWTFTGTTSCISLSYVQLSINANATFKFASSASCSFSAGPVPPTCTLWVASGALSLGAGYTVGKIRVDGGATLTLASGGTTTANTWQVVGSASSLGLIAASNTTQTTIKSGVAGATVYLDFCKPIKIATNNGTFIARSSVDGGGNTGITFFKLRPNFLTYF